ncbi:hypothetical protein C1940_17460 (plasmid) [Lactiplantibacillus plantarum subsp. plantarum]|uniref:pLS20_p028 family conjugation system transmembrane protein n=1 Tax=Lactiplantibacillus plantarum TaxID=1590 RepID=UPI000CD3489B|nr:hypothetical protein [Lactiplantibacillus plantarum]AUV74239.1 hypothetical protein C1940_17460 [Lactiplantibacillus plantarum subsp. plantarum]
MFNPLSWLVTLSASGGIPQALYDNNQSIDKVVDWLGGNSLSNNQQVVRFYYDWYGTLQPHMLWMDKMIGWFNDAVTLGLYHTAQALESVFMAVLKLFGFFADFNVGEMGTLYKTIVLLGFALLMIGLGYLLVENIFRAKTKLHEVVTNLVVVIAVLVMLPFGTNLFSQFVMAGSQDLVGTTNPNMESISAMPIKTNIIDNLDLASTQFKTSPQKINSNIANYNDITDDNIGHLDFSDVIASNALRANGIPKGVDNVFKHTIKSGVPNNKKATWQLDDATLPSSQTQLTKVMDPVYPRYTGHFFLADIQLLLLAVMFGIIAFRVGKSWFEILMLNAAAPLMGFQDLRTNQRLKALLKAIQGSFIAVFAELIGLRLFLIVLNYLSTSNNPGIKFLSHYPNSALPIGFFLIIMYLASFIAFMSGVSLVERWTGVPQSKGGTALNALGVTATGMGVATGISRLGKATASMKSGNQKINKELADNSTKGNQPLPDPTKSDDHQATQMAAKTHAMGATERDDTVADQATLAPNGGLATQNAGADSAAAPDGTSSQIDDQSVSTASPSDSAAGSASSSASGSDQPTPELTTPTGDEGLPDPTKEAGSQAKTVDGLPDPTAGVMPVSSASSDNGTTGLAKEAGQTSDELNTLPDPTAGVTASNGTSAEPASWDHEAEGSLNGTQPRPNPTAGVTVPSSGDQSAPTVGAEVSSADRPEGLAREDGASEPMPQPAHGDQVNKGVISPYDEDEREVFERPVDDHQPGSLNDGAQVDRTTTQPQSAHEVNSAPGKQPSVAGQPKRSAGKKLIKAGSIMTAAAREHGNDEQSMVNLPEIKIDDSIY